MAQMKLKIYLNRKQKSMSVVKGPVSISGQKAPLKDLAQDRSTLKRQWLRSSRGFLHGITKRGYLTYQPTIRDTVYCLMKEFNIWKI